MPLTEQDQQPTHLSKGDQHLIRRAMARMPYGGNVRTGSVLNFDRELTVEDLVDWLDKLAATLRVATDQVRLIESELFELRRQRSAVRAFLGTEAIDATVLAPTYECVHEHCSDCENEAAEAADRQVTG